MQNPWMMDTLRRLRDNGYEMEILAPSYQGLPDQIISGFVVYRWRYFPRKWESLTHDQGAPNKIRTSKLYKFMFFPYLIMGMIRAFRIGRKNNYDVIHCHWPFPQGLIGLAARLGSKHKEKPALIMHFHGASLLLARTFAYVNSVLLYLIKKSDKYLN